MSMQPKRKVIAVDDDDINLMILTKGVEDAGYEVKSFTSGEAAWEFLQKNGEEIDIALLDKMMPGMSGLSLLKHIKATPALKHIAVIIQTGDVGLGQMREGLESGAHYYLTKPFHPEILRAILHSAENDCAVREELMAHMQSNHARFIGMMRQGEFLLTTHQEARILAASISHAATHPEFVALGLMELLANAIEHGNLEISFDEKKQWLMDGTWQQEVEARHKNPRYAPRRVQVAMERTGTGLHVVISDDGKGFDWSRHVSDEEEQLKLNEPSGRGIAKAMIMLDDVQFAGRGNEVHCHIGMPHYFSLMAGATTTGLRAPC